MAGRPVEWREGHWSGGKASGLAGRPVDRQEDQWSGGKASGVV